MKYIDVTRSIFAGMEKYPTDPEVRISVFKSLKKGDSCDLCELTLGSHTGTHVDAPSHILEGAPGVDNIAIKDLICEAIVTDIANLFKNEDLQELSRSGVKAVLFKNDPRGLTAKEAEKLISSGIKVVGTDRMSIEGAADKNHPAHRLLLAKGVVIVENLDLTEAALGKYKLICLPLKIKDGDGSPARVVLAHD